jgi:diguanylate cyclase (GGDEF)-like protein
MLMFLRSAASWLALFSLCLLVSAFQTSTLTAAPAVIDDTQPIDLADSGKLYAAGDASFPERAQDIPSLLTQLKPAAKVNLFGGDYWLYAELRQSSAVTEWVLDPNNTLIDRVEARIYAPDGSTQRVLTGYRHDHQYMLHYGKSISLQANVDYQLLIKFSSPYFASSPRFEVWTEANYRAKVFQDNILIIGCLGAVASLALFNLMLFASTRDKSALYYALYLISFGLGWAFVFHIPVGLFGLRNLSLHYIPFFLTPVTSALFCIDFLKLRENFPRLAKLCVAAIVVSLLLLPVSFLALKYAHTVATIVIGLWLPLAIVCAIVAWRNGYRPARFFAIAFLALLIPGALILPANLGLMDDVVQNSELFTLVGGTIDAILLAFALADKIKLLGQEKDNYLLRLNHALMLAHTDSMTGIGNRHAFDQLFDQELKLSFMEDDANQPMLILVDLDGLKLINDKYGHARGDELLRAFARALQEFNIDHVTSFRLGGDEFAIFARKHHEATLRDKLQAIERSLGAQGFAESGVSFGVAFASESSTAAEMFNAADRRMYETKTLKRTGRHPVVPLS